MAEKRIQYKVDASGNLIEQRIASSADIVDIESINGLNATNVQDALEEIKDIADNGGVTSVNGKTGAVTLGKGDVGLGNVTNEAQIPLSQKGANNGVATLDGTGKVPTSQLPSYVDDVLEYSSRNSFPRPGESGKIYVASDTNLTYRWSGTDYVEISPSIALGETSSTAYAGDKGKANADAIVSLKNRIKSTIPTNSVPEDTDIPSSSAVKNYVAHEKTDLSNSVANSYATKKELHFFGNCISSQSAQVKEVTLDEFTSDKLVHGQHILVFMTSANTHDSPKLNVNGTGEIGIYNADSMAVSGTQKLTWNASDYLEFVYCASPQRWVWLNSHLTETGVLSGTYSAVNVDRFGRVLAGGQMIEWGISGQTSPSDSLAEGGLFFKLV